MANQETVRMSLDLTPQMREVLENLAEGSTKAVVLRKAIALLKAVKDAEARGESPALVNNKGDVTARLIGI